MDQLFTPWAILQLNTKDPLATIVDDIEVSDVSFVLQRSGYSSTHFAVANVDGIHTIAYSVADPGEHVSDGVRQSH
jgi:hypothetical protein